MKLYYHPISGHAHRARLFLSLIEAEVDVIEVNLAKGEHKAPEYLAMDRFGQVPLLDDDGTIIADSNAIMVYAAKKFSRTDWLPKDIETDDRGFVRTGPAVEQLSPGVTRRTPFLLETSRRGVFAAGDVRASSVKRVASAVGEGSMAIQFIHEYLKEM